MPTGKSGENPDPGTAREKDTEVVLSTPVEQFNEQRMEGNDEIFSRVMSDRQFRNAAQEHLAREVHERIRNAPRDQ